MGETNYHLKDDFFEEILNGIPESEEKRQEYLKNIEKNSKTSLSPDNKTRIKRVAVSFLSTEESKKAFIELIKNVKKREQNRFLKDIKKSIFLSKIENDEGVEEEISEDIEKEENKSGGLFSKAMDLKKKYQTIRNYKMAVFKIKKMATAIREVYEYLSGISYNDALKTKNGIIEKMNKTTNEFLEGNFGGLFHTVIVPTIFNVVFTFVDDFKRKVDNGLSKYYNIVKLFFKAGTKFVIAKVMKFASKIAFKYERSARAVEEITWKAMNALDSIDAETGNFDLDKFYKLNDPAKKIEHSIAFKKAIGYFGAGVGAYFGFYDVPEEEINRGLNLLCEKIERRGEDIINKMNNKDERSFSDKFQLGARVAHDVYEEGSILIHQEYENMGDVLMNKFDNSISTQNKFNFVYEVISNSYFKKVDLSPWSRSARIITHFVKYIHNSFKNIYEPLDKIVVNQSYFYNSKGQVVDVHKHIKNIVDNFEKGVVVTTSNGKKLNLKLKKNGRKSTIKKSSNEEENAKYFQIDIKTKRSIKKSFEIDVKNNSSKLLSFENNFKPVVKIKTPKNKTLNFVSTFIDVSKNKVEKNIHKSKKYNFEEVGLTSSFYESLNESVKSKKITSLMKFFNGMNFDSLNLTNISSIYYDENYNGNYNDSRYMQYYTTNSYDNVYNKEGFYFYNSFTDERGDIKGNFEIDNTKFIKAQDIEKIRGHEKNRTFRWSTGEGAEGAKSYFYVRYNYPLKNKTLTPILLLRSEMLMECYLSERYKMIGLNYKHIKNFFEKDMEMLLNYIKEAETL